MDNTVVYETSNLSEALDEDDGASSEVSTTASSCYWYCSTREGQTWVGKCDYNCRTHWCGAFCNGTYQLHHVKNCGGTDVDSCCNPGCPSDTDCTYGCQCGDE